MTVLVGSRVKVIDNSGATFAECIEIYEASKYRGADIGDIILVTLKRVLPNKKVKQGDLIKAIVVRSKSNFKRSNSHRIKAEDSAIVLVNNTTFLPRAKRARSLIMEEVRKNKTAGLKVLSIAPVVL
jgi:large subunit ribosomal protein L14